MDSTGCEKGKFRDELFRIPSDRNSQETETQCTVNEAEYFAAMTLVLLLRWGATIYGGIVAFQVKRRRSKNATQGQGHQGQIRGNGKGKGSGGKEGQSRGISYVYLLEVLFTILSTILLLYLAPFEDISARNGKFPAICAVVLIPYMVSSVLGSLKMVHLSKKAIPRGIRGRMGRAPNKGPYGSSYTSGNQNGTGTKASESEPHTTSSVDDAAGPGDQQSPHSLQSGPNTENQDEMLQRLDKVRGNCILVSLYTLSGISAVLMLVFMVPLCLTADSADDIRNYIQIGLFFMGAFFAGTVGVILWQIHRIVGYVKSTQTELKNAINRSEGQVHNHKMKQLIHRMELNAVVLILTSSGAIWVPILHGVGAIVYTYELMAFVIAASAVTMVTSSFMFSTKKSKQQGSSSKVENKHAITAPASRNRTVTSPAASE